jgi:hypothetical protein
VLTKRYRDAMRSIDREASEPLPDPWAMAAGVVRDELARRERVREEEARRPPVVLRGLSEDAAATLAFLHHLEGRAFLECLHARVPLRVDLIAGVDELIVFGLVVLRWAVDEDGDETEPILELRYDVELPEPPDTGKG